MDSKVLEKIQKLLCLAADNPEAPESKLAAERAAELMAKHGVGIEDVDSHGKMKEGGIIEEGVSVIAQHHQIWESSLASVLCDCFDCKRVINTLNRKAESRTFIGAKSDVAILTWFYKYIRLRVAKHAEKKFRTQRDQKSFGLGAVNALEPRLLEMYKRKEEVAEADSRALVHTKQVAVQNYFDQRFTKLGKGKKYGGNITQAYHSGYIAGESMPINQQIGG